jgi:hypothetical protein
VTLSFVGLFLVASAHAGERPVLDLATDDLCPPRGLHLNTSYTPPCDGVAVSMTRARWQAEMVIWADEQATLRKVETATYLAQLKSSEEREAWWKSVAETKPEVKKTVSPVIWLGTGVVAGVGITLAAAWGLGQIAEATTATTTEAVP